MKPVRNQEAIMKRSVDPLEIDPAAIPLARKPIPRRNIPYEYSPIFGVRPAVRDNNIIPAEYLNSTMKPNN